jgi:hypothetical protein
MRRTLPGLSLAAAAVLLTACGGSDDENASSESSASSSSAAETTAEQTDSEFCTEASGVIDQVNSSFTGATDPSTFPQAFQEAADSIRGIEPPAELEADWTTFGDGIQRIAEAAQVDFNDPEAVAAFQQEVAGLQQEFGPAFDNVGTYLSEECGIDPEGTESAAPTS